MVSTEIEYGSTPDLIPVEHPVHQCLSCGEQWADHVAEGIRDEAVRQFLARAASTMKLRKIVGTSHSGIPIYTKRVLRDIPPELGQRYAVRTGKGHVRGPYEIVKLWPSGCYLADAVYDIPDFPYVGGDPNEGVES